MNHFKIESSIVISREIVTIGQNWAYKNGLKLIRVIRLKMEKGLNWNNMAARTGAFSSVPVRLTHLDGLNLNMFLTHFCFRQLSPLIRDLNNTCYPFLTTTGGFDWYSGLSGLKFGPVQRWVTSKNFRIFSNILDFSVFRVPKCQKCRLEQICLASAFSDFFLLRLHRFFWHFCSISESQKKSGILPVTDSGGWPRPLVRSRMARWAGPWITSREYKSLKWKNYEIKNVVVIKIVRAD